MWCDVDDCKNSLRVRIQITFVLVENVKNLYFICVQSFYYKKLSFRSSYNNDVACVILRWVGGEKHKI
jgi:hypothetical protein